MKCPDGLIIVAGTSAPELIRRNILLYTKGPKQCFIPGGNMGETDRRGWGVIHPTMWRPLWSTRPGDHIITQQAKGQRTPLVSMRGRSFLSRGVTLFSGGGAQVHVARGNYLPLSRVFIRWRGLFIFEGSKGMP